VNKGKKLKLIPDSKVMVLEVPQVVWEAMLVRSYNLL